MMQVPTKITEAKAHAAAAYITEQELDEAQRNFVSQTAPRFSYLDRLSQQQKEEEVPEPVVEPVIEDEPIEAIRGGRDPSPDRDRKNVAKNFRKLDNPRKRRQLKDLRRKFPKKNH